MPPIPSPPRAPEQPREPGPPPPPDSMARPRRFNDRTSALAYQRPIQRPTRAKRVKAAKSKANVDRKYLMLRCPICLDNLHVKAAVSTKCGHVFCRNCLQRALALSPYCPACRKTALQFQGYHALYLDTNYFTPTEEPKSTAPGPINTEENTSENNGGY